MMRFCKRLRQSDCYRSAVTSARDGAPGAECPALAARAHSRLLYQRALLVMYTNATETVCDKRRLERRTESMGVDDYSACVLRPDSPFLDSSRKGPELIGVFASGEEEYHFILILKKLAGQFFDTAP
ncbi:hypothetical protein EVAR_100658_1 [Eumeta japonica]|uniref:Uncharacterized protein n=1 Tax=Eumeta variegata TaxID=151549 RepID=A0A4C1ZJ41_EUMVA|nr:hypothetical protein EVAR_100658_1 [Eumeta japonica]